MTTSGRYCAKIASTRRASVISQIRGCLGTWANRRPRSRSTRSQQGQFEPRLLLAGQAENPDLTAHLRADRPAGAGDKDCLIPDEAADQIEIEPDQCRRTAKRPPREGMQARL
jgi:hypothetical protein